MVAIAQQYDIDQYSPEELEQIAAITAKWLEDRHEYHRADFFDPTPKQKQFLDYGKTKKKRALFACVRGGKTTTGCYEDMLHATGDYPDWWDGKVFPHKTKGILIGLSAKQVRESAQEILLGKVDQWGTGMIPAERLVPNSIKAVHGTGGAVDRFQVYNRFGGVSDVLICGAESGRERIQGLEAHYVHADEDWIENLKVKPMHLFAECMSRLLSTNGVFYMTSTPERGLTQMVNVFWKEGEGDGEVYDDQVLIRMTLDDCIFYTLEMIEGFKREMRENFPDLAEAKINGIPTIGTGLAYPFSEEEVVDEDWDIMDNRDLWHLGAMDCGYSNSFNAPIWGTWDRVRERGVIWDGLQDNGKDPYEMAPILKQHDRLLGMDMPWAWPLDLSNTEKSGIVTLDMYTRAGVNMLPKHAAFEDGSRGIDAGVFEVRSALKKGWLKLARGPHVKMFMRQMGLYARDEKGNYPKKRSQQFDLLDAIRYWWMMVRRFAERPRHLRNHMMKLNFSNKMQGIR